MVFEIKQERFEGPLHLLLSLIERRELHIGDIALSKVTDDFLGYVGNLGDFPIAESADFAYIASTLLLIKSKALLPELSLSKEEEENIEDLQNRLKLLRRFRELSGYIRVQFGKAPMYFREEQKVVPVFAPPKDLSPSLMLGAIHSVLAALPKVEALGKVAVKKVISLEQMIEGLKKRITSALRMSFKEFSRAHREEKVNIIVGFLAMLELVKEGLISVSQEYLHGDITMETGNIGVPRY
ncbi:hypothetical protein A2671_02240 [Candidatus Kaiserbacteria bacterium RIFCSPHIGHO2_01_FULL_49_13]|uniref:Segregation and condensation protein A n=1 Tax=Candidatus Kaiserbacteria bacterium RIFCSPHIGHO2_01_FULL_49_13 TaxID=1798477 RepID=A0A1F6CD27_9BACT|nr:MAG: hypothetical protein A2671_02240 [Candidatus Kaiserbacteria bacterium RIFCSPHIGHO2_01_FULL_49_13]